MTNQQRRARIKHLESRYPVKFLQRSLHADAIEWRALTAPNAASFDEDHPVVHTNIGFGSDTGE